METKELKGIIEALLFVSSDPIKPDRIASALEVGEEVVRSVLEKLKAEYEDRVGGMQIVEVAGGYQMTTRPEHAEWLRKFYTKQVPTRLSRSALETLAIIAYKQPITKAEVDAIRGVNSDSVINSLLAKGLITISGRKRSPGRPLLYSTTDKFLHHFGLKDLSDLPSLEEMEEIFTEVSEG
ncbi:TPA: SMC-Scp complex subunit ScpB [Candidatus Poribacteria bacterium]|nr:SMC-Scp complex subunit ScpB [Candidatus Poribacteria bacterium]